MYDQISLFEYTLPKFQTDKPIRLIELFAGIGSQAMALRDIGADFEHYRVVEFDRFAVASYNAIHGTNFPTTDITKIHGEDLGIEKTDDYCYIMTYSFPCQDLSPAGMQRGMKRGGGTRSGLLWEVERLLNEVDNLPQVLLMENVPQVHLGDNSNDFSNWIRFLERKGYSNYYQDLDASDYGVAQNRKRCFMVSILGKWNYKFPIPIKLEKGIDYYMEDECEKESFLSDDKVSLLLENDKKCKNIKTDCIVGTIYTGVSSDFQRGVFPISRTLKAESHDLAVVIFENGKFKIRKFTPLECWRLMGFSDEDFRKAEKVNSSSQLYKQAGNSIVKPVLMEIFRKMMR